MFYTCNYNIRVTHRNGAIKRFLPNQFTEDHQQIDVIHFINKPLLALHLAVKILLQIFLYEDLSTLNAASVGYVSPEYQQDRTLLRSQYY